MSQTFTETTYRNQEVSCLMLHRIPKMIDRSYPQVCLHETPFYTCEEFPINVAWSRLGQPTLKMTCATASPALRLRFPRGSPSGRAGRGSTALRDLVAHRAARRRSDGRRGRKDPAQWMLHVLHWGSCVVLRFERLWKMKGSRIPSLSWVNVMKGPQRFARAHREG